MLLPLRENTINAATREYSGAIGIHNFDKGERLAEIVRRLYPTANHPEPTEPSAEPEIAQLKPEPNVTRKKRRGPKKKSNRGSKNQRTCW